MGFIDELFGVNFIAVLVAAIAGFAVGAIWYSPIAFGNLWMKYNPFPEEVVQKGPGPKPFAIGLICMFMQTWVFALFLGWLTSSSMGTALSKADMVSGAIWIGFLMWLGFTACTSLTDAQFSNRPFGGWLIDAGHRFTATLVTALILGFWLG